MAKGNRTVAKFISDICGRKEINLEAELNDVSQYLN